MYESDVEKNVVDEYKKNNGIALKITSPGFTGITDRLGLSFIKNKRHRKIVAQYVQFLEIKKPKKKRSVRQQRVGKKLNEKGYEVKVIDDKKWRL
jgi:hypothetical protein